MGTSSSKKKLHSRVDSLKSVYNFEICLGQVPINKRVKLIHLISSSKWLSILMLEASKDIIDIFIGQRDPSELVPTVADVKSVLDSKEKYNIKIIVSWRSSSVKIDNLALALGIQLWEVCGHQKIDSYVWESIGPASNVPVSYSHRPVL